MELFINNKENIDKFTYLFKNIKNITTDTIINFNSEFITSQGMNPSKSSIYNLKIGHLWFDEYKYTSDEEYIEIGINTVILSKIFNTITQNQYIKIIYDTNRSDYLFIEFCNINKENKNTFDKYFEVPLMDLNYHIQAMSSIDPDVTFEIDCNKLSNICSQTKCFHDTINIKCTENNIKFKVNGIETKFTIKLDLQDVNEYSIVEDLIFSNYYDLTIFDIICSFSKLANIVVLSFDNEQPMIIDYKITNSKKTNQTNNVIEEKDQENDEEKNEENDNKEYKEFMLKFYLVSKTNNNDEYSDDNSDENDGNIDNDVYDDEVYDEY